MLSVRLAAVMLVALAVPQAQQADWKKSSSLVRDSQEAELIVRVGDIDNLGFGWPAGFDPFTGQSTEPHEFPYQPSPSDPAGTDRIMVPSSYKYDGPEVLTDGYTGSTKRPDNNPRPIVLEYQLGQTVPKAALLRMFIDDFQSPVFKSTFQATLNGERAPFLERVLNAVEQTGPVGKLITVEVPAEYVRLLQSGRLSVSIDDTRGGMGDGFAVDFVELLINPRKLRHVGTVTGRVTNKDTERAISGAVVWAGGVGDHRHERPVHAHERGSGTRRVDGLPERVRPGDGVRRLGVGQDARARHRPVAVQGRDGGQHRGGDRETGPGRALWHPVRQQLGGAAAGVG